MVHETTNCLCHGTRNLAESVFFEGEESQSWYSQFVIKTLCLHVAKSIIMGCCLFCIAIWNVLCLSWISVCALFTLFRWATTHTPWDCCESRAASLGWLLRLNKRKKKRHKVNTSQNLYCPVFFQVVTWVSLRGCVYHLLMLAWTSALYEHLTLAWLQPWHHISARSWSTAAASPQATVDTTWPPGYPQGGRRAGHGSGGSFGSLSRWAVVNGCSRASGT